jgi:hypothetical protein
MRYRPESSARLGSSKTGSFRTFADLRVEMGLQVNEASLSRVGRHQELTA